MDGFLNILKPANVTSHDVVAYARRVLKQDKIGHLGTLDPLAVGVLPLALGSYRRLSEYFLDEDKDYITEFTFGISTDTGDLDGKVLSMQHSSNITARHIVEVLPQFQGRIMQVPSQYSALKYKGRKMYELAREGLKVQPEPRPVHIYDFRLLHFKEGTYTKGLFFLRVSSGTYVRSLAKSLGESLGVGGVVSKLLRTRVGGFTLKESYHIKHLKYFSFMDVTGLLPGIPRFFVKKDAIPKIFNGVYLKERDFVDPGSLKAWIRTTTNHGKDFFAFFRNPNSGVTSVAAVLRFDGNTIKYRKVLK